MSALLPKAASAIADPRVRFGSMLSKNASDPRRIVIPLIAKITSQEAALMGRQTGDQASLFYEFQLEDRIPKDHLLRRINVLVGPVLDGEADDYKSDPAGNAGDRVACGVITQGGFQRGISAH
jgi:hypothetical protein